MKNLKKLPLIFTILSLVSFITPVNAEVKVVTSIKPIHSLASYLMDGVGKPDLIVDGYASPHGFSMKPSHAKMLQDADLIFWVGEDLENFLEKPLNSIAKKAEKIELMDIKGLNVLSFRERNIFDDHDDHDDHEGHAKKKKDDHDDHDGHAKKKKDDHDDHDDDKPEEKAIILGLEMTLPSTITISASIVLVLVVAIIGMVLCFKPSGTVGRRKRVQFDLYM